MDEGVSMLDNLGEIDINPKMRSNHVEDVHGFAISQTILLLHPFLENVFQIPRVYSDFPKFPDDFDSVYLPASELVVDTPEADLPGSAGKDNSLTHPFTDSRPPENQTSGNLK